MSKRRAPGSLFLAAVLTCSGCGSGEYLEPAPIYQGEKYPGGEATVLATDADAFTHPVQTLDLDKERSFFRGRALFRDSWVFPPASTTSRDGLGPLFNATSCNQCHRRDGRGRPPLQPEESPVSLLFRLSTPAVGEFGAPHGDPVYGDQFHPRSVPEVEAEGRVRIEYEFIEGTYGDGERFELRRPRFRFDSLNYGPFAENTSVSPRVARRIIGLGLLASIPEQDILEGNGLPNWVWNHSTQTYELGRFGWKASQPSVRQQTALAFVEDMGLTTSVFTEQPCTDAQTACNEAIDGGTPEIIEVFLDDISFYASTLAVPARRDFDDPEVARGQELFDNAGCRFCHVPRHVTGKDAVIPQLAGQEIYPYTDLLLHDMGPDLADGRSEFDAKGYHWRTPPLWGLGLIRVVNDHFLLLHDGRARGVAEAILWHGGEAEGPREAFRQMTKGERKALVRFVESL